VALVSQSAFHPMFKISTIHQHTSFNPNRRSHRSLRLRAVGDMVPHACARTSTFKHLHCKVVQSKRFSSFARELSYNSQWSVPYNKVQNFNKCFNFFSKRHLRGFFMTLLDITKNRRLIITKTIENWYSELLKEVIINRFHLKMQLLQKTRQDSGEFIFQ